jgi:hypothetical protein
MFPDIGQDETEVSCLSDLCAKGIRQAEYGGSFWIQGKKYLKTEKSYFHTDRQRGAYKSVHTDRQNW